MTHSLKHALLAVLIALPLGAQPIITAVVPPSGPASGGTEVSLIGTFNPQANIKVYFGDLPAVSVRVIDSTRIVAVTPEHIAGLVTVWVIENSTASNRQRRFLFAGEAPSYERLLLPIWVPPAKGAFGSEFHTTLRLWMKDADGPLPAVYGVTEEPENCPTLCMIWQPHEQPLHVRGGADDVLPMPRTAAIPGRFVYVERNQAKRLAMNLRVADVSRSALNFGTEIPIVRESDFFTDERIALLDVPLDPRFRNTLRLYGREAGTVFVTIGNEGRLVTLQPGRDEFEPAYAVVSDFPAGLETVRVTIDRTFSLIPLPPMTLWAFISVTNNETQMITTITPQR